MSYNNSQLAVIWNMCVCLCIYESLFCLAETNQNVNQLHFSFFFFNSYIEKKMVYGILYTRSFLYVTVLKTVTHQKYWW